MANHLGPFPEASDGPEGQEQPVWAVGGQGELCGVTQLLIELETCFFLNHRFLGMANYLGPFPRGHRWTGRTRPASTDCRRSRRTPEHQIWWCSGGVLVVL